MTIAEEELVNRVRAMSPDEKRLVAKTLESEYMRDELQARYDAERRIFNRLGGNEE